MSNEIMQAEYEALEKIASVFGEQAFEEWLKEKNYQPKKVAQPNYQLNLTKAEFVLLLSRAIGTPFVLDVTALRDLNLNEQNIQAAETNLMARHYLPYKGAVPSGIAELLRVSITQGWKSIIQLRSQQPVWRQVALHFAAEIIVGEAINYDEKRLLVQFDTIKDTLTWLVELTVDEVDSSKLLPPQALELLLPQAQAVVTWLLINSADTENTAQASAAWILTDSGLWFADKQADKQYATNLSKDALLTRLHHLVNYNMG